MNPEYVLGIVGVLLTIYCAFKIGWVAGEDEGYEKGYNDGEFWKKKDLD